MVASYRVVPYLQRCYAWVITSSSVHNYWKCYINVVTRTCSGFYWYIRTLPRALRALGSRAYISVKPLAAVLQYINVRIYNISIYNFFTADTPRTDSGFPDKESGCRLWIMLNLLPTMLLSIAQKTTIMFNITPITNAIMPQLIST